VRAGARRAEALPVPVRVKPGASRPRVGGRFEGPHGPALVVAVHAPPVQGQATEAVRRALAKALGVPSGRVLLRAGAASRDKLFLVEGAGAEVAEAVARLRDGPSD
jgi:uncharacterized protein YggU (UPF0235/DUF167 family)